MYFGDLPLWGFVGKIQSLEEMADQVECDCTTTCAVPPCWLTMTPVKFGLWPELESDRCHGMRLCGTHFLCNHIAPDPWVRMNYVNFSFALFQHVDFHILYSGDKIVQANLLSDHMISLDASKDEELDVEFTYSVNWIDNADVFLLSTSPDQIMETDIRWLSVANVFVVLLLFSWWPALILRRMLKGSLAKIPIDEELAKLQMKAGWRGIKGDVFRFPKYKSLLAAVIGSGTQLLTL